MKVVMTMAVLAVASLALACSDEEDDGGDGAEQDDADDDDAADDDAEDEPGSGEDDDTDSSGSSEDGVVTGPMAPDNDALGEEEVLIDTGEDDGVAADGSADDFGSLSDGCEAVSEQPEQLRAPVDIVFVIDNSSSMDGEIRQVQERINEDFARIIDDSGVDYRVVLISRYGDVEASVGGSDHPICIRAPLGAHDCSDPEEQPLTHNPPHFFHYSADSRSREAWCDVLDGWDTPDELLDGDADRAWEVIAPIGWRQFVREGAFKHFVVITDDDSSCSRRGHSFDDGPGGVVAAENAAIEFDTALLALAPRQFGSNAGRNYRWHSIVAMAEYDEALEPWPASEPIQTGQCSPGSDGPGTGFQALSRLTGGLRYPTCNNESFDAIFEELADGVIRASFACEWAIPQNDEFTPDELNVRWVPGSGESRVIAKVQDQEDCGDRIGWYYDEEEDPQSVIACPSTCALLQTDPDGRVDLLFGCETVTAVPLAR